MATNEPNVLQGADLRNSQTYSNAKLYSLTVKQAADCRKLEFINDPNFRAWDEEPDADPMALARMLMVAIPAGGLIWAAILAVVL